MLPPAIATRRVPTTTTTLPEKLAGKKLPLVDRVEISIMEEANPRMLAFESHALDYFNLPPELSDRAIDKIGRAHV